MALIKCPECGKEVSDKAEVCIHCGYPIAKEAGEGQAPEGPADESIENPTTEAASDIVHKEHITTEETAYANAEKTDDIPKQEMTNVLVLRKCGPNKTKCAEKMSEYNSLRMNYRDSKHFINKVKREAVNPGFYIDKSIYTITEAKEELEALGCTLEIITMPEDEAQKLIPPMTQREREEEIRRLQREIESHRASSGAASAGVSGSAGPKCPTCGSTDIQKIGAVDRVVSTQVWGLSSKKINKTFKCKKCGYSW